MKHTEGDYMNQIFSFSPYKKFVEKSWVHFFRWAVEFSEEN